MAEYEKKVRENFCKMDAVLSDTERATTIFILALLQIKISL